MSQHVALIVQKRDTSVKASAIREQCLIPGVVYGHGIENTSIQCDYQTFRKAFEKASYSTIIDLKVESLASRSGGADKKGGDEAKGKGRKKSGQASGADDFSSPLSEGPIEKVSDTTVPVIVQSVTYHPIRDTYFHVDFHALNMKKPIKTKIPLEFVGVSEAIKLGGVQVTSKHELHVTCLPTDLVHSIPVDISVIKELNQVIHVKDITIPPGITVEDHVEDSVVTVMEPKIIEEEAPAPVEGEVAVPVEGAPVEGAPAEGAAPAEGDAKPKKEEKKEKKEKKDRD